VTRVQITTSASDEVLMKTPSLQTDFFLTTPASSLMAYNEHSDAFDNHSSIPMFANNREANVPFSTTENFWDSSWKQRQNEDLEGTGDYEGLLSFLKIIQNNLFKYKNKSRTSKISVLKNLRDHLLVNIKERITNLWKPEVSSEARGYKEDDSHMDFPSNEGALMTIGFLTFAVFLIKLIIKLVHALKYKQQYYGMTTTTTSSSVVFLRKKREERNQEAAKILQYIDEF
ncbi:hypothetical protein NQ318_004034, partial [Aromia moschata]